jgi:hypothetical protein
MKKENWKDITTTIQSRSKLFGCVVLVILLVGCSTVKPVVLHPIEKSDIFTIPQGAVITIPAGTTITDEKGEVVAEWKEETIQTSEKSGYFLSDLYLEKVVEAKVAK